MTSFLILSALFFENRRGGVIIKRDVDFVKKITRKSLKRSFLGTFLTNYLLNNEILSSEATKGGFVIKGCRFKNKRKGGGHNKKCLGRFSREIRKRVGGASIIRH